MLIILYAIFAAFHIKTAAYEKALILGPYIEGLKFIFVASDTKVQMSNPKLNLSQCDLYFMVQSFCLIFSRP